MTKALRLYYWGPELETRRCDVQRQNFAGFLGFSHFSNWIKPALFVFQFFFFLEDSWLGKIELCTCTSSWMEAGGGAVSLVSGISDPDVRYGQIAISNCYFQSWRIGTQLFLLLFFWIGVNTICQGLSATSTISTLLSAQHSANEYKLKFNEKIF